ncbi:hypothetical protein HYE08_00700 [Mycoplasmopsis bovis]|nr:hypothetical protein [Mycoplasmopsis bovis]QQH26995.1 hypothetical protein HYE08_00700 [Mycoplasmopsis bovis]
MKGKKKQDNEETKEKPNKPKEPKKQTKKKQINTQSQKSTTKAFKRK